MGIREKLVNNPVASTAVAAGLIVLCGLVIFLELKAGRPSAVASIVGKTFFSDDDGKTWFLDDASKIPPFDHNGAQAYRAVLFRCKTGTPFVAYLAKFSVKQTARMAEDAARNPGAPPRMQLMAPQDLKKPGGTNWITFTTPTTTGYPAVNCPNGSGPAMLVFPTDPDSGVTN
jgi:hypothetical protein